ncbi:Com family DNA-binding transcriptional regulator [Ancylobacter defluvii]|uniref:Com family DNA-binding transcriptional regulator n=1 Tax=Ancylobacter defluvii TaxID=1282440 RepID=UPI001BCDDCC3|nr:Com family DNA-binding transcriptional regulator [Ancylobacter defluvii]
MRDVKCGCGRLLFRAEPIRQRIDIKCRRCGVVNSLRPIEPEPERPERHVQGDATCASIPK